MGTGHLSNRGDFYLFIYSKLMNILMFTFSKLYLPDVLRWCECKFDV